jgi:hypothetical protein
MTANRDRYLTREQVASLLEERDILREQVRQLEAALAPAIVLPALWKLTNTEQRFLSAIRAVGPNVLTHDRAILALYGSRDEAPEVQITDILLCHARRKLRQAKAGITIETIWGRGWRMTLESCVRFDAAVSADLARWDQAQSVAA